MILQALNIYYDILLQDPKTDISPFGYSTVGVSFALNISARGALLDVFPLYDQVQRGKKMVDVPRPMLVPEQGKHTNKVSAFCLCDNTTYVLGISDKDESKPEYSLKRFKAFRQFNTDLLTQVDCDSARAIIAFLNKHDPSMAREHSAIARHLDALLKGSRLVFMFRGTFVHEDSIVREAWENYKFSDSGASLGQCIVTGEIAPIARLHPSVQGVRGANPTGASLVSFNERAYESYNRTKQQGLNAPTSEKAVFTYNTALKYLLSNGNLNKKNFMGDTTVVFWAESKKRAYESAFASIIDPEYVENEAAVEQGGCKIKSCRLPNTFVSRLKRPRV